MTTTLRITAPSRLHFGLLRFAQPADRSFGGLGMMIAEPRVVIELGEAERWSATGPYSERALQLAEMSLDACAAPTIRAVKVEVLEAPAPHSGLGSGTQLALAVAAGVRKLADSPAESIDQLAASVGRGDRSAVGGHGFELGGLIWEVGRLPQQTLGELRRRADVPDEWRVVLATFHLDEGLSGDQEAMAFERLPPVPCEVTEQLTHLAEQVILPAAEDEDFAAFSSGVYEYGYLAGNCFAAVQGGPFASPQAAAAVARVRELGVNGVGQSSWGPTIFAFTPDAAGASELIDRLEKLDEFADAQLSQTAANNRGARMETIRKRTTVG